MTRELFTDRASNEDPRARLFDRRVATKTWNKIMPEPNGGCWLWLGSLAWNGYATRLAHRRIYKRLIGDVPRHIDLDHLCRVRCCVNPAHLEPVTRSENLKRGANGDVIRARAALVVACPKGHPYDDANTYWRNGGRGCRACRRALTVASNLRRAAMARARRSS